MFDFQKGWVLLLVVGLIALIYLLQPILTPFLVGALLAYLGDPLADRFESWGLGRTASVSVVFLILTIIVVVILLFSVPLIGRQIDILLSKLPVWLNRLQQLVLPWLQQHMDLPKDSLPVAEFKAVITENWVGAGNLLSLVWAQLASSGLALIVGLTNLLLIPVVTFYLLRDWDRLMAHIRHLLPRASEKTVVRLGQECDEIIGAFIRGQLLVMLALALVYSTGLWVVGLDLALIVGLTAGLASVVPYMGFIVGIAIASIAAFFQFHEWMPLLGVTLVFAVGQLLEGMVLTPLLVGDRIGLHPVAVIFAIMAGGQLFGFTGVLLALPAAALIMVLVRHVHRNYKNSDLYVADT
ncbi:MAG: AI-2E family transporter [Spongiibacteraceae bacterium]|nr:AI-2E family transporter [Spongiibacteraceae bacterium]